MANVNPFGEPFPTELDELRQEITEAREEIAAARRETAALNSNV
jgi:hypothetical protein